MLLWSGTCLMGAISLCHLGDGTWVALEKCFYTCSLLGGLTSRLGENKDFHWSALSCKSEWVSGSMYLHHLEFLQRRIQKITHSGVERKAMRGQLSNQESHCMRPGIQKNSQHVKIRGGSWRDLGHVSHNFILFFFNYRWDSILFMLVSDVWHSG